MMNWKFSCESKANIPLPPEYTFPQAFNYLNPECNSFYILEAPDGSYLQCGGSKERCIVEWRCRKNNGHHHYVLGRMGGDNSMTSVIMTHGAVELRENEVFRHWEAIDLFKLFFAGEDFPSDISYREVDL